MSGTRWRRGVPTWRVWPARRVIAPAVATVGGVSESDDQAAQERRSRLLGLKLRALVRDLLGDDTVGEAQPFSPGAALLHGDVAWVLLDANAGSRLGAAISWALRSQARSLQVVAEDDTATLARRAAEFAFPIEVWQIDGREMRAAVAQPAPVPAPAPAAHEALRSLIVEGGATPVVEHGVLVGEVRGLEVCRVVDDPFLHTVRLEVGVGAHDREAFQMMHGDVPTVESLARIVRAVQQHRNVGAHPHPLNRLGAERLIRWQIEQQPELVGAVEVRPASPPVQRINLKDPVPCVGHGVDADGALVVVVCASGVDLDLVPFALDARSAAQAADPGVERGVRLVVVTPTRDRVAVIDRIAACSRRPVEFVSID